MGDAFEVSIDDKGDGDVLVVVRGDLDLAAVPRLREAVEPVQRSVSVVIDCSALDFVDSSGLGCLVELRNRALDRGGDLRLINVPRPAARTITMGGLAEVLGIDAAQ
jgi:anti-anti-sigma factor